LPVKNALVNRDGTQAQDTENEYNYFIYKLECEKVIKIMGFLIKLIKQYKKYR